MKYFLYLRRSFTRAWREHLLLVLLLSCAMSLPLCMSIMYAGYVRGERMKEEYVSGGHDMILYNAQPDDMMYFENLPGGTAVWEDGKLYIDRDPDSTRVIYGDEKWSEGDPLQKEVAQRTYLSPNNLIVEYCENYFNKYADILIPGELFCAVGVFSGCILCFAYGVYWHRTSSETRKLQSVGASGSQIMALSFVHLILVQCAATLLAVLSSMGTMYFLTNRFLVLYRTGTHRHASNTNYWMAFDVNPVQILAIIGIAFIVSALFFLIWHMAELCKYSLSLSQRGAHPFGKIRFVKQVRLMLAAVFLRSGTVSLFFCLLAAIPLMVSSMLLIQLRRNPEEEAASISAKSGIRIGVDLRFLQGFTADKLTYFENLEGVERVEPQFVQAAYYYTLRDDRSACIMPGNEKGYNVDLIKSGDVEGGAEIDENGEKIYNIVYYPGRSGAVYDVGTVLTLYANGEKTIKVRITDILDEETANKRLLAYYNGDEDWARGGVGNVYMFCSGADLREMTEYAYCNSFYIYLTHVSYNQSVEEAVFDYFTPEQLGLYINNYTEKEIAYRRAVGMNLLYTTLSVLLYVYFAVITTLSLIDYAMAHKNTIRILHMQGAPHGAILAAFAEIMLPPGLLTCAAVWAIVPPVVREYYRLRGYTEAYIAKLDMGFTGGGVAVLIAAVAVFVLPVLCTVARLLRELDDA